MRKSLLTLILALLTGFSASAYSFALDNDDGITIYYLLNPGGLDVSVTYRYDSYNSYSGDVVIPETVTYEDQEYPVTAIGDFAFYKSWDLTSVTIPASIKQIGRFALSTTQITSVTIPASVTSLGDYAFYDCQSLGQVSLPNTIPAIGECTFSNCVNLTNVNIPLSAKSLGEQAFYYCRNLTSITIPQSVEEIGAQAFGYCYTLTSVTLEATSPSAITVASDAFESAPLASATLTVPAGCKSAFEGVGVWGDFATIEEAAPHSYSFYEVNEGNAIYYNITPGLTTVSVTYKDSGYNSYSGEVVIPSRVTHGGTEYLVTTIGEMAFYKSTDLTAVTIPSTVREIGNHAFAYTSLISVEVPSSVTTIGNGVFLNCVYLFDVSLPNTITTIPVGTFCHCTRLEKVNIPASVTSIGEQAFLGCYFLQRITIPSSVTEVGPQAFSGCGYLGQIALPSSVTVIGAAAFESCGLQSVILPASAVTVGDKAFAKCKSLNSVVSENPDPSAITLGTEAFSELPSDATLRVPKSSIDLYENSAQWKEYFSKFEAMSYDFSLDNAYGTTIYYCFNPDNETVSVTSNDATYHNGCYFGDVTIPASVFYDGNYYDVTAIRDDAFYGSETLTSVHIPNSVTKIGVLSFYYCLELKTVKIPDSVTEVGRHAFGRCMSLTSVTLPANITTIEEGTFQYCESLASVTIPNSVINVGHSSFIGCSGLESVILGNAVARIYDFAFCGCEKLKEIVLPPTLNMIGMQAFENCKSLTSVKVQNDNPNNIELYYNVFQDVPVADATLYVPEGSEALYRNADQWSAFGTIEGYKDSGIENILTAGPASDPVYYDLSGRRVIRPASGIYIVGGRKVLVP